MDGWMDVFVLLCALYCNVCKRGSVRGNPLLQILPYTSPIAGFAVPRAPLIKSIWASPINVSTAKKIFCQ